jgi:hypothetical protein
MGHAGAIIAGGKGTAQEKMEAMKAAGITVVENPALIGEAIEKILRRKKGAGGKKGAAAEKGAVTKKGPEAKMGATVKKGEAAKKSGRAKKSGAVTKSGVANRVRPANAAVRVAAGRAAGKARVRARKPR